MKKTIILFIFLIGCQTPYTEIEGKFPVNEFLRPNGWNDHYYVG
jgi:hypothetical protein